MNPYDKRTFPFYLFYADDIILNGENLEQIQKMLNIVDTWCKKYHMKPGLKKCQWIGPPSHRDKAYLEGTE